MAFLFADSYDHYATADQSKKWTGTRLSGNCSLTIGAFGRHSSNGLKIACGTGGAPQGGYVVVPASGQIAIAGIALELQQSPTTMGINGAATDDPGAGDANAGGGNSVFGIHYFRYQSTTQCWLRLNVNGTLSAMRGTTILGTTAVALSALTYYYIEFKVKIDPSVGTVDIQLNGVNVLSLTGQNTRNASASAWDEYNAPHASGINGTVTWLDDCYLLDGSGATSNNFLGDVRIDCIFPNAAGDETNWTPDSGANYARVSENPFDGDTSYVAATTAATKDTYKTAAQPVTGANIFAIQMNMMARKTDAGAAGLKPVIRIAGTDYLGTEQGIPSTYFDLRQIYDLNPATGVAWVDGDIGPTHAQFGIDKST